MQVGALILDSTGVVTWADPRSTTLLGLTNEECLARSLAELLHLSVENRQRLGEFLEGAEVLPRHLPLDPLVTVAPTLALPAAAPAAESTASDVSLETLMELAAASNAEVVRSKRKAMKALGLRDDIEDILITLGKQYHLIRPLKSRPAVFFYVALDRSRSNLAMARYALADAERELAV